MKKIITSVILIICGLLVFLFGSPYFSLFPTNRNQTYYVGLACFFGIFAWILKRDERGRQYWPAAFAFFIGASSLVFLRTGILNLPSDPLNPLREIALDKVSQALHIIPVILLMTFWVGENLKSLYIARGNLRAGLTFGLISFAGFAMASIAIELPSKELSGNLGSQLPWILLFVFANSLMEELWFRSVFLKRFNALIGRWPAIIVTSIVFGAAHINATYAFPGGGLVYGAVVIGLGVVGAYAMMKDESIIGPFLFHAGYDLIIINSILQSMA